MQTKCGHLRLSERAAARRAQAAQEIDGHAEEATCRRNWSRKPLCRSEGAAARKAARDQEIRLREVLHRLEHRLEQLEQGQLASRVDSDLRVLPQPERAQGSYAVRVASGDFDQLKEITW